MNGSLTVERRLIEPYLRNAADSIYVNSTVAATGVSPLDVGSVNNSGPQQEEDVLYASLPLYERMVWIAFSQYLDVMMVHGTTPSVDYIVDEYAQGRLIDPAKRDDVLRQVTSQFAQAASTVTSPLRALIDQMTSYGEEIMDVKIIPCRAANLALIAVQSEPY